MKTIKVSNLKSPRSGESVKNQFEIYESTKKTTSYTFQSYYTIIAKVIYKNGEQIVILDKNALDYSRTTSKYLYQFLDDVSKLRGMRKKEILKAIENKEVKIKNLN
tara:strand:+ start:1298 stop:1615 length:318 start_codon:yes stop_codon:yes gene_type:complete